MALPVPAQFLGSVFLYAHGVGIPLTFRVDDDGYALVSCQRLSLRFQYQEDSISVEEEICDELTGEITHTLGQVSFVDERDCKMWSLTPGRFRVYGLTDSQMAASTEILTPRRSSTCTIQTPGAVDVKLKTDSGSETPLLARVKVEPGLDTPVINLSSDDDGSPRTRKSAGYIPAREPVRPEAAVDTRASDLMAMPPSLDESVSIVSLLKKLTSRPGKKNLLKKLDYDSIRHERVEYLPAEFNGDVIFELPPVGSSASRSAAKSMQGMDKRYDGHVWTKTITTNISNNMGLSFRSSSCAGHLRCENKDCGYLERDHRIFDVNETEFDGCTLQAFVVGEEAPKESTLVCKECKEPPVCVATCRARIFYVSGKGNSTRACIHVGSHNHPVKVGDYRDIKVEISSLIENQIENTPKATKSAVVLEASKDLIGSFLLRSEDDPPKTLTVQELYPVLDRCKDLASPNIRNKVVTFRYLRRFGVMDSITRLRGLSTWDFVQNNMFPGQGSEVDKVYVFKMSELGPASGVDLVKRMQPTGDLELSWMMFDHVRRVRNWTTMACHVYDSTYCRVMTIACCDMQSEDAEAQMVFWKYLNAVMKRHGVEKPNFKGFMADSAQANWNAVRVVYGNGNKEDQMEDRERTCQFHWTQSMVLHTEKHVAEELWDQHKKMCQQYRKARSMAEADALYHGIRAWWASAGAVSESALSKLDLWLSFWHYRYRQWGGFMTEVTTPPIVVFSFPVHAHRSDSLIVHPLLDLRNSRRRNSQRCRPATSRRRFTTSGFKHPAIMAVICTSPPSTTLSVLFYRL
jgi:hypothetical protein